MTNKHFFVKIIIKFILNENKKQIYLTIRNLKKLKKMNLKIKLKKMKLIL